MLAQETCSAVAKIFMVAEHSGARLPDTLVTTVPSIATMVSASTFGGPFVPLGILHEEFVEITVGNTLLKVGLVGVASPLGVSVLSESVEVMAQKLTDVFGKHQINKDALALTDQPTIDIETNELDGTPDATTKFDDIASASVTYKESNISRKQNRNISTNDYYCKESSDGRQVRNAERRVSISNVFTTQTVQRRAA